MLNSKAAGLVRVLDEKEREDFARYLSCGYFVSEPALGSLFGWFCTAKEEDERPGLRQSVFRRCFPRQAYDDKKLRYLMTELCRHIGNFLVLQQLRREEDSADGLLSRELALRGAEKAYSGLLQHMRQKETTSPRRDADYYFYRFTGEFNHLAYAAGTLKRDDKSNIEDTVGFLDRFYLARKLQLCCEIFNVRNVLSVDYKVFLLEEILRHLENRSYEDTPVIRIYYRILMTLLESDREEHFASLRELLLLHDASFSRQELREMYQYVLNYCIKKINTGHVHYQRTLFEIYQVILANDVLLSEGHLSQWDYKNIVTISLRLQEFDWAGQFIAQYKSRLPARERENAYIYNMAFLHFHRGEYSKTLQLLQKVEFTDLYYQLDSRVILLKIYFELDDTETFFYHAAAFKTFLRRNKLVSDYQRTIYLNLVKFTSHLFRAGTSKTRLAQLKQKVNENRQVADLAWLLKKVEERE